MDNKSEINQLSLFSNEEFGNIRVTEINGIPYFMASDVAKALGYSRPNDAVRQHCRATVKYSIPISGKIQEVNFIKEGDLYRLITHSKLPSAERFESWVFDEVLPTIRKTGSYSIQKRDSYMIEDPIERAKRWIEEEEERRQLQLENQELKDENERLEKEHQEMFPKAEFYDTVNSSKDCITMEEMAKILKSSGIKIGRNRLFEWLRIENVLMRNNLPYQKYLESGHFRVREYPYYDKKTGEPRLGTQTIITPKGQDAIVKSWVNFMNE